jgi:hypothetical protein
MWKVSGHIRWAVGARPTATAEHAWPFVMRIPLWKAKERQRYDHARTALQRTMVEWSYSRFLGCVCAQVEGLGAAFHVLLVHDIPAGGAAVVHDDPSSKE